MHYAISVVHFRALKPWTRTIKKLIGKDSRESDIPTAQQMLRVLILFQDDSDGDPLHHLYVISRGIFGGSRLARAKSWRLCCQHGPAYSRPPSGAETHRESDQRYQGTISHGLADLNDLGPLPPPWLTMPRMGAQTVVYWRLSSACSLTPPFFVGIWRLRI